MKRKTKRDISVWKIKTALRTSNGFFKTLVNATAACEQALGLGDITQICFF